MVPRMATIAAYIKAFGVSKVLDVGCGTGDLLAFLAPDVAYVGVDIAPTAIHLAREHFAQRQNASFYTADFRHWTCPLSDVDGVVWAGVRSPGHTRAAAVARAIGSTFWPWPSDHLEQEATCSLNW